MEESFLQMLLTLLLVILFPSYPVPLTIFTLGSRLLSSQTLQVLAMEKSFVKLVVSGQWAGPFRGIE